ncbi:Hypothetical protein PBC10988_0570 [Planctomycetales bacterium 10988]|nr:Hypothetical protein PBC10988_0570 [Planctomycetales bacterium 10988]
MAEDGSEPQFDATPTRKEKARNEGHLVKSSDLTIGIFLLSVALSVSSQFPTCYQSFMELILLCWQTPWLNLTQAEEAYSSIFHAILQCLSSLVPLLFYPFIALTLVSWAQSGGWFPQRLIPDLNRVTPSTNFQKLGGFKSIGRGFFSFFKYLCLMSLAGCWWWEQQTLTLSWLAVNTSQGIGGLSQVLTEFLLLVGVVLVVFGVADFGWQWWQHQIQLRMTTEELREEQKQLQGDPTTKGRRRTIYSQITQSSEDHGSERSSPHIATTGPIQELRESSATASI